MWRVLIQLPSLISECVVALRAASWYHQQSLLLQQETNQLLREMIVKVTTQPAETPVAVTLSLDAMPSAMPSARAWPTPDAPKPPGAKPYRIRTERDITRNTRSTIAEEQFKQQAQDLYPHRQGERLPSAVVPPAGQRPSADQLPPNPHQSPTPATRPLGGPPV